MIGTSARWLFLCSTVALSLGCDKAETPAAAVLPDEPIRRFRNIETATDYVGDAACRSCHDEAASAYQTNAMARSFHRWTPETRIETALSEPLFHRPTGFYYSVVEVGNELFQEEFVIGPGGKRLHQLRRRIDYVMGSGAIARSYFTDENGRLFQLPLTWYREQGWDFSPGYEINNARFDRLMPDRCLACHGSYPKPFPFLEGKYAELVPGIGCERCHGPGALHVSERSTGVPADSTYDATIVNPRHLPIERRVDVCDQCHVHTPVTVLREGQDAFSYQPSEPLSDHAAFFKATGSIDIVSHADRLRQSACFVATRATDEPLECATCHNPHQPTPDTATQNEPCVICHATTALEQRLASSPSRADHVATANCVSCHMPQVKERTVPHGSFTEHWIRVVDRDTVSAPTRRANDMPVDPYYERDRSGPEANVYQGMGQVIFGTRAPDARILKSGAQALKRALRRDETRGEAHFVLGLAYRQLDMRDDAIRALERSVEIDPDRPQRLHALARTYEGTGHDPADVARLYERALELQPALAWIRADYADFLSAQGRLEEAEVAYRAALAERPSLDVAAFNLGTLLAEMGRLTEASEVFGSALRLDPSLGEAISTLVLLRTAGSAVGGVRMLGSPLGTLPVRGRGRNAVQLTVRPDDTEPVVLFVNVPARASVRVVEPDGALVRAWGATDGPILTWDLKTRAGVPVDGGLYHVEVRAQDTSGQPLEPQRFSFGVVRQRDS